MPKLKLVLPSGEEPTIDLNDSIITVGRVEDNTIQIQDASVSSYHAELSALDGEYLLKDLGSTNGTYVNGEQVQEVLLKQGDQVRFGSIDATYVGEAAANAPAEAPEELPEVDEAHIKVADVSERPDDFTNASPFQKKTKKADPLSMGVMAVAVLSILCSVGAAFLLFQLQAPF